MKIFLYILGALALLVSVLLISGLVLPREHRATSRIELPVPADSIWEVIRDLSQAPSWWPEVKTASRLPDQDGQERYVQEMGDDFSMTLVIKESIRPTRLHTVIDAPPGSPFGGGWIYELAPSGSGTAVRLTEDGWIANPLFRVISRIMGYHRTLDDHLRALGRRFGETVRPEHVS